MLRCSTDPISYWRQQASLKSVTGDSSAWMGCALNHRLFRSITAFSASSSRRNYKGLKKKSCDPSKNIWHDNSSTCVWQTHWTHLHIHIPDEVVSQVITYIHLLHLSVLFLHLCENLLSHRNHRKQKKIESMSLHNVVNKYLQFFIFEAAMLTFVTLYHTLKQCIKTDMIFFFPRIVYNVIV